MLYNKYRKWRNHKYGFPRYRKKHIYNGQITDVFFIYSLFVHIINIIVNKVTFIVTENINPSIRNSKKSTINTTSLSHSKNYEVQWQHTSAFYSFPMIITILHFLSNYKRAFKFLLHFLLTYFDMFVLNPKIRTEQFNKS